MNEQINRKSGPSAYVVPLLEYPFLRVKGKKRITEIIAEAWEIPENMVLGSTDIVDKEYVGTNSLQWTRPRIPGERQVPYANARKFYFYVMIKVKKYSWRELTKITGRKIAAMRYASTKAQEHMKSEKDYMTRAQYVLDLIAKEEVIFPKPAIELEAVTMAVTHKVYPHQNSKK